MGVAFWPSLVGGLKQGPQVGHEKERYLVFKVGKRHLRFTRSKASEPAPSTKQIEGWLVVEYKLVMMSRS